MMHIAISKPVSAILFIIIALSADFTACTLVNQKLINKYEHTPTPSQPTNNTNKLSAVTKTIIANVNSDKKLRNLGTCGSVYIYPQAYRCIKNDSSVIITSIVTLRLSNINDQSTSKTPQLNHLPKSSITELPLRQTSLNKLIECIKETHIDNTDINIEPFHPT